MAVLFIELSFYGPMTAESVALLCLNHVVRDTKWRILKTTVETNAYESSAKLN